MSTNEQKRTPHTSLQRGVVTQDSEIDKIIMVVHDKGTRRKKMKRQMKELDQLISETGQFAAHMAR